MVGTFTYQARDRAGKLVTGRLEGESVSHVAGKLRSTGYVPVAIEAAKTKAMTRELHLPGFTERVKLKDVAIFSRQFATMVNSGLTLLRSLSILAEQTQSKPLAKVVNDVRLDVERGSPLSVALTKHPKVFSTLYVAMVRSGEASGSLDSVLSRLATTLEKQMALRRKVKSAMTYPVVVGLIVVLILVAMLVFVVPMFEGMFADLDSKLPAPTLALLSASHAFTRFWYFVVAGAAGAFYGARRFARTSTGRRRLDALKLRAPVFGPLAHKSALARFARSLAALLRSGVPILQALDIVGDTSGNLVIAEAVSAVKAAVKTGDSLSRPLEAHSVFPPMVVQMLAVGEETGALDELLEKVAEFYDAEVEAMVDALTSLLEPLLIVAMGTTVGSMVVALYMPMFSIITKLGDAGVG